jgi:hypothetical protein
MGLNNDNGFPIPYSANAGFLPSYAGTSSPAFGYTAKPDTFEKTSQEVVTGKGKVKKNQIEILLGACAIGTAGLVTLAFSRGKLRSGLWKRLDATLDKLFVKSDTASSKSTSTIISKKEVPVSSIAEVKETKELPASVSLPAKKEVPVSSIAEVKETKELPASVSLPAKKEVPVSSIAEVKETKELPASVSLPAKEEVPATEVKETEAVSKLKVHLRKRIEYKRLLKKENLAPSEKKRLDELSAFYERASLRHSQQTRRASSIPVGIGCSYDALQKKPAAQWTETDWNLKHVYDSCSKIKRNSIGFEEKLVDGVCFTNGNHVLDSEELIISCPKSLDRKNGILR